jgi:hypothetical protein
MEAIEGAYVERTINYQLMQHVGSCTYIYAASQEEELEVQEKEILGISGLHRKYPLSKGVRRPSSKRYDPFASA